MNLRDLITDASNPERISSTKLWSNVAHLTATIVFINQAFRGMLDYNVWLVYLGIVGAQGVATNLLSGVRPRFAPHDKEDL